MSVYDEIVKFLHASVAVFELELMQAKLMPVSVPPCNALSTDVIE